jgi:cytidine deaminase
MNEIRLDELLTEARKAAEFAYAPYSKFRVGAALLADDGTVFSGCNVENRSFGLTICAERTALVKALSCGYRSFKALAVSTPDSQSPVGPCGACRQVLSEFMPPDSLVFFKGGGGEAIQTTLGILFPYDSLDI